MPDVVHWSRWSGRELSDCHTMTCRLPYLDHIFLETLVIDSVTIRIPNKGTLFDRSKVKLLLLWTIGLGPFVKLLNKVLDMVRWLLRQLVAFRRVICIGALRALRDWNSSSIKGDCVNLLILLWRGERAGFVLHSSWRWLRDVRLVDPSEASAHVLNRLVHLEVLVHMHHLQALVLRLNGHS